MCRKSKCASPPGDSSCPLKGEGKGGGPRVEEVESEASAVPSPPEPPAAASDEVEADWFELSIPNSSIFGFSTPRRSLKHLGVRQALVESLGAFVKFRALGSLACTGT